MTRLSPFPAFSLSLALTFAAASAQAQTCTAVWEDVQRRMAAECNDAIPSNTMCFAYPPLVTSPAYPNFTRSGDLQAIGTDLNSIRANASEGSGGFFYLKIITERAMQGFVLGQAIISVAFGDTELQQMQSIDEPLDVGLGRICTARLKYGSTTFGGSYLRAMQDPRFQVECARFPCEDKNNLLYFAEEGQPLDVLGRSADGGTLLVTTRYATGWITAAPRYLQLEGCSLASLPVAPANVVETALREEQDLEVITSFRLTNTPTAHSAQCIQQSRPPGGLLILNPSHQAVHFAANSISISLSSAVLLTNHWSVTRIFVLQGVATVTNAAGQQLTGRSGDVIASVPGVAPEILRGEGPRLDWCEALSDLARAALGVSPDRVPFERIAFCNFGSGGYPAGIRQISGMLGRAGIDAPIGLRPPSELR